MSLTLSPDTCMLTDSDFFRWVALERSLRDVNPVVSPIVYMERRRQILNHGDDPSVLEKLLEKYRIRVMVFDKNIADMASWYMSKQTDVCPLCGKLDWADVMILAGTERPLSLLVTRNTKDFEPYDEGRVMSPESLVGQHSMWSDPLRKRQ